MPQLVAALVGKPIVPLKLPSHSKSCHKLGRVIVVIEKGILDVSGVLQNESPRLLASADSAGFVLDNVVVKETSFVKLFDLSC